MSSSNSDDLKIERPGERNKSKSFQTALRTLPKKHPRDDDLASAAVFTDSQTEYVYQPLKKDHIRVFELLPGYGDEDIHIQISMIELPDSDEYSFESFETLSYAWGTTENPRRIWIDLCASGVSKNPQQQSAFLNVTQNLFQALLHIRRSDVSRTFWVDAICINQRDARERSAQVQLMSFIYQNTKQTTVWLGPAADDSNRVFELFRTWTEFVEWDYKEKSLRLKNALPTAYTWLNPTEAVMHVLDEADMFACQSLLDRPWFERVWVRQEIALSEDCAEIVCGNESMSWERFRAGLYALSACTQYADIRPRAKLIHDLIKIRRTHLIHLLGLLRVAKCSDPRDRIFSTLGLLTHDQSHLHSTLQPDYTMDVRNLYIMVGKCLIQDGSKLRILGYCDDSINSLRLPSWVPDWSNVPPAHRLRQQHASLSMVSSCIIHDSILNAKGVFVSRVEKCEHFDTSHELYQSIYDNFSRMVAEFTGAENKESYRSTIANLIRIVQNDRQLADFSNYNAASVSRIGLRRATDLTIEFLSHPLRNSLSVLASDQLLNTEFHQCYNWFVTHCLHRSVVLSADGQLALAPKATEPGDIIVIIFGYDLPLILRSQGHGCYKFLGTAFAPGLVWGEALVGAFAHPWSLVNHYESGEEYYKPRFRNKFTGEITALDPRIDWSQLEVGDEDPRRDRRLSEAYGRPVKRPDEEYLRKNTNIKIETFSLI